MGKGERFKRQKELLGSPGPGNYESQDTALIAPK